MTLKFFIHYSFHLLVPLAVAYFFYKNNWKKTYIIFLLAFVIDLDHLLATPIFQENRCSINFHPLHSYIAIGIYVLGLIPKKTRVFAIGLLFHILADTIDCWMI